MKINAPPHEKIITLLPNQVILEKIEVAQFICKFGKYDRITRCKICKVLSRNYRVTRYDLKDYCSFRPTFYCNEHMKSFIKEKIADGYNRAYY